MEDGEWKLGTRNGELVTGHSSLVTQENEEQRTKNVERNSLDRLLFIFFPHPNPSTFLPIYLSTLHYNY